MALLEEVDSYHFQWTLICPTCMSELSGIIPRGGWLQLDPTCPKCQCMIAGFTNPCWPRVKKVVNGGTDSAIAGNSDDRRAGGVSPCFSPSINDPILKALRWTPGDEDETSH